MSKRSISISLLVSVTVAVWLLGVNVAKANGTTCTLTNWSATVGNANLSVGSPSATNRRYAGPCGLRVTLAGAQAYVTDNTPNAENDFNARFYFFLNDVTADVTIFEAVNATPARAISATYDQSENKVNVVFQTGTGSTSSTLSLGPVSTGWNGLEIQWSNGMAVTPKAILRNAAGTDAKTSAVIDTSYFTITAAKLGAISGLAVVPSGGSIDFDDYDSRRVVIATQLCRGLTDSSRSALTFEDAREIFKDSESASYNAGGQPDYNMDGAVNIQDAREVFARAFSTTNRACGQNE